MRQRINYTLPPASRLTMFLCVTVLCVIVASLVSSVILHGAETAPRARIAAVITDIVMFVTPALATAVVVTRTPARFLMVESAPPLSLTLLSIGIIVAAIPAMNLIIYWNSSLHLPESMAAVEEWMKDAEQLAQRRTELLIGGTGLASFIISVLIVGILASFSEELFFRGTLQRLISSSGASTHVAVWTTAIIFSAIHFQFFGFFPRLLLGALFGYIVAWSGNLWLGVVAHFTNNFLASAVMTVGAQTAVSRYVTPQGEQAVTAPMVWTALASLIVTVLLLLVFRRLSQTSSG